jgi:hypothetical protein
VRPSSISSSGIDHLDFWGYNAVLATITQVGATNQWQVSDGTSTEIFTLQSGVALGATDFLFH